MTTPITPAHGTGGTTPITAARGTGGNGPITVTVADDHTVVRAGVAAVLDAEPDITVIAQAGDGATAVEQVLALDPDVTLMDVRMPIRDGLEATATIAAQAPRTRVVVLTSFALDEYVLAALRAGAAGFLLKDATPERVIDAVRVAAAGEALIDPAVTGMLIARLTGPPARELPDLTPRERQVLTSVARGLSNAEIAAELRLSAATVKDHVAAILAKLGVRNRLQATIRAYESGLVTPAARRG